MKVKVFSDVAIFILALALMFVSAPLHTAQAQACGKTWVGGVDELWSTAGNWNPSGVPTFTDDVCITSGASPVVLTGSSVANSVNIGPTMTLWIKGTSGTSTIRPLYRGNSVG